MQQKKKEEMAQNGTSLKTLPKDLQMNLSDFALFLTVMKVKEAYEDVLSIVLNESGLKLKEVKTEEVILNKSGKETRYKYLPSTMIIFITQEDIFGKDLAMYTFSEQCEEVPGLALEDGTQKIFLNMASMNGRKELVSLLQYMKNTTLDNPNISVLDERIQDLHRIVEEVKQSEEWEVVKMGILEIGLERGMEAGKEIGKEIGMKAGMQAGRREAIAKAIEILRDMDIPDEEIRKKISLKYEMPQTDIENIMEQILVTE